MNATSATGNQAPLRNFDAYMSERVSRYEPLERDDEPQDVPRLSREEIKGFFDKQRAAFADRSPEQEKKSFESYFARQKQMSVVSQSKHLEELRNNPAFKQKSETDLQRLSQMRATLAEGMEKKGTQPQVKAALIEKFDKVYSDPAALSKLDDSLDFSKPAAPKERGYEGISH